jgi:hypothetical protein
MLQGAIVFPFMYLSDVYQVCSNKDPGVKIGPALGVIDFPKICIVKA